MAQQQHILVPDQEDEQFFLPWDVAFPFGFESPAGAALPPPPPPLLPFSPYDLPVQSEPFDTPSTLTSTEIGYLGMEMEHPWMLGGVQVKEENEGGSTSNSGWVSQPVVAAERKPKVSQDILP